MNKTDFMLFLDEICEVNPGTIKPEDSLKNTGLFDSIATSGLIIKLDKKFNVFLDPDELLKIDTVEALFDRVTRQTTNEKPN